MEELEDGTSLGWSDVDAETSDWSDAPINQNTGTFEDLEDLSVDEEDVAGAESQWAQDLREKYLDELMRHEALGKSTCNQPLCSEAAEYRCQDCFGCQTLCRTCFVSRHKFLPLHSITVSSYTY